MSLPFGNFHSEQFTLPVNNSSVQISCPGVCATNHRISIIKVYCEILILIVCAGLWRKRRGRRFVHWNCSLEVGIVHWEITERERLSADQRFDGMRWFVAQTPGQEIGAPESPTGHLNCSLWILPHENDIRTKQSAQTPVQEVGALELSNGHVNCSVWNLPHESNIRAKQSAQPTRGAKAAAAAEAVPCALLWLRPLQLARRNSAYVLCCICCCACLF